MITIDFQEFGKSLGLRLRLYKDGETKFFLVNKLLQGRLPQNIGTQKKQSFIPTALFSKENDEIRAKNKNTKSLLSIGMEACRVLCYVSRNHRKMVRTKARA